MPSRPLTEAQFQQQVIQFLQLHRIWHVKYWGGGRFTKAGVPDILACVNGHFVAIELKTETGQTSKLQEHNLAQIQRCRGSGIVLRPHHFDEFQRWIREVKSCNFPIPAFPLSNSVNTGSSSGTSID